MDALRSELIVEQAFLLRTVNYGDNHRIVSLLTKAHGRVDMIALGAKKSQKRSHGLLDFLNQLHVEYQVSPRGGLYQLKELSLLASYPQIRSDYDLLMMALEWFRLLAKILQQDSSLPKLFESLQQALAALEFFQEPQTVDVSFRYQALAALGYELQTEPFVHPSQWSLVKEALWDPEDFKLAKRVLSKAYQDCLAAA